jgi:hypothetical protein
LSFPGLGLSWTASIRRWLPEVALVLLAIALRLLLVERFDPRWGYDAESHIRNIDWYRTHAELPALSENRTAYHPPLFYLAQSAVLKLAGADPTPLQEQLPTRDLTRDLALLQLLPLLAGVLRCLLVGLALALLLRDRPARLIALLVAAVLPVSVHLDAMVSNESLNVLFGCAATVLLVHAARPGPRRGAFALALGAVLGLGLLTKFSSLMVAAAVGAAALLDVIGFDSTPSPPGRIRRLAWWGVTFSLMFAMAGSLYLRNLKLTGELTPSPLEHVAGWDRDQYRATGAQDRPYWKRRSFDYFVGWNPAILTFPFFPTASGDSPRFWPVLLASTFVDHYNYGLARDPDAGRLDDSVMVNGWPLRPAAIAAARVSLLAGCLLGLTTLVAWPFAARSLWRSRDLGRLAALLVPLFVLLGQLHFAVKFPVDREGVVKGAYLQLGAGPLCALLGCAVSWLWRRRWGRPLALLNLAAVLAVAAYLVLCLLLARGVRWLVFWG